MNIVQHLIRAAILVGIVAATLLFAAEFGGLLPSAEDAQEVATCPAPEEWEELRIEVEMQQLEAGGG